jgi:hypothetical protein
LSDKPKSREHIHNVMLNATFYVGISKLMAKLECSKSAAVLYALNEGLFKEGVISKEDYDLLQKRYSRKLKDVIAAGREDSHKPVLTLEQLKKQKELEQKERQFKGMLEQWDWSHADPNWKLKAIAEAEKYSESEFARLLVAKGKEFDIISQEG